MSAVAIWGFGLFVFIVIVLAVVAVGRTWYSSNPGGTSKGKKCKRGRPGLAGKPGKPGQPGANGRCECKSNRCDIVVVSDGVQIATSNPDSRVPLDLQCPAGYVAVGGGGEIVEPSGGQVAIEGSIPTQTDSSRPPDGWRATAVVLNGNPSFAFDARLTCVRGL